MKEIIKTKPIGIIHTPYKEPKGIHIQGKLEKGITGRLELFAEYRQGLKDIEGFSYIILIYYFDRPKDEKVFDALEWLAAMCSHVPNKREQMVRYYGYYSKVLRGKRQKEDQDDRIPFILEPGVSSKEYRKNWTKLIQKIYEVDPLTCPKCSEKMKVISVIKDEKVIKKILKHLGLWEIKTRPLPRANALPKAPEYSMDYADSQLPVSDK